MAALLTDQTTNTTGSGSSHTGPCSVFIYGTFDGASVSIEAAHEDVAASYVPVGTPASAGEGKVVAVNLQGTYYLRAKLNRAGSSTSLSVDTTQ